MTDTVLAWVTGPEEAGERLDVALAARPEVGSRGAAQRLVDDGRVRVDGRPRAKGHRLAGGERVEVNEPGAPESEALAPAPHRVVFEDEWIVVVDKPAGVVVHPAAGHRGPTLAATLAGRAAGGEDRERAGIVHRLDKGTSGLLVVAKDPAAHARLQADLRARAIERAYLALVAGHPSSDAGTIDAPLGRDRVRRTLMSTRTDRPREARTHFEVAEVLSATALLRLRLDTGRTHQIRAHLTGIGHPVCGDRAYAGGPCGERLGLRRQFLHAHHLALRHPVSGQAMAWDSALPGDLARALARARAE